MKNAADRIFYLLLFIVIGCILYNLGSVLLPFLIGILLAYISTPIVNKLKKHRIPHILAVVIAFLTVILSIILLLLLLVPLIQNQIIIINQAIPKMMDWFQSKAMPMLAPYLSNNQSTPVNLKGVVTENFINSDAIKWAIQTVFKSSRALIEIFMFLILIPVVMFYLLRDWDKIIKNIIQVIPRTWRQTVIKVAKECEDVLGAFVRGQLIVITALSFIYALGFYIMGLQLGVTIGIIMGALSFIPYLGVVVGVIIASLAALYQFGTLTSVFWALIIIIVGHVIDNIFLTPTLLGERIGLHPVVVIFAILAGGALMGFAGVLLALPLAAVCMVILRHLYRGYTSSSAY